MVERFNGRIASEVLGINVGGHADLEILLTGFNRAYNRRRQRVLQGNSPHQKVEERITSNPALANPLYKPLVPDDLMNKVDDILYYANDGSQPDSNRAVPHMSQSYFSINTLRDIKYHYIS